MAGVTHLAHNNFALPGPGRRELKVKLLWAPQKADVMDESGEHLFRWVLQKYIPIKSERPCGVTEQLPAPMGAACEHSEKGQDRCMVPGVGDHSQPACGWPQWEYQLGSLGLAAGFVQSA